MLLFECTLALISGVALVIIWSWVTITQSKRIQILENKVDALYKSGHAISDSKG